MSIFDVIKPLMDMVGTFVSWLFATPLIPGIVSLGTVLFGSTVLVTLVRVVEVMMSKPVDDGNNGRTWRKRA